MDRCFSILVLVPSGIRRHVPSPFGTESERQVPNTGGREDSNLALDTGNGATKNACIAKQVWRKQSNIVTTVRRV